MKLEDLKAARYNPRVISDRQLAALGDSIERFGDLSGVVFNRATRTLISGHQRIKTLREKTTRIVTQAVSDSAGTVALGHIEVLEGKRVVNRIPYREVNWADKKAEMAANIAANAHGGTFDNRKLADVLARLEKGKFALELTGIDPLLLRTLTAPGAEKFLDAKSGKTAAPSGDDDDEDVGFETVDPKSFNHDMCCPKCKFKFKSADGRVKGK